MVSELSLPATMADRSPPVTNPAPAVILQAQASQAETPRVVIPPRFTPVHFLIRNR